ncbi:MAG: hypothetical protein JSW55_14845 [Chloroflexota bacterium]|nr:MAG: hypothetical protein JSW55_14845 [Chloroflexota bacterium]
MRSIDVALDRRKLGLAFGGALAFILAGALFGFLGVTVSDEVVVSAIFLILGALASWVLYALFSGAIAHMSWQDLTQGARPTASEALAFSWSHIVSFLFSPLALLVLALLIIVIEVLLLLLGRIPYLGELLVSLAFLPLVVVNILLLIGLAAGMWLIFPIVAARGSGVVETLQRVVAIVRHSPLRLVTYFAIALIIVVFTLAVLWFLVVAGRFVTLRAMNAGVGEDTMRQIATSNPFGALALPGAAVSSIPQLLFGEVLGSLPEPLGSLLGSQGFFGFQSFEEPRFTMDIAGFIMGLSTVALFAGLIYVFPWVFTLSVSCSIYHNLGDEDEVEKLQGAVPSFRKPAAAPPVQASGEGAPAQGWSYQPPAQPGGYQPPAADSPGTYQPPGDAPGAGVAASSMKPCIECGREVKVNSRFCPFCGSSQS